MAPRFEDIAPYYKRWWADMRLQANREPEFKRVAARLRSHADAYEDVEAATGVPWEMVAVIHLREADANFNGNLANGDPWNQKTTHVPRGYGPWASWHQAAVWALKHEGLAGQSKEFWTVERMLYYCEAFNGWGYWLYHDKMPSPYIWGGTSVQKRGKYVGDGKWDPDHWDMQLGCAGLLQLLLEGAVPVSSVPSTSPAQVGSGPHGSVLPVRKSWWQRLLEWYGWKT